LASRADLSVQKQQVERKEQTRQPPRQQIREQVAERVSISGDEIALAILDGGERAESVNLHVLTRLILPTWPDFGLDLCPSVRYFAPALLEENR
jgi:hypothetical protein